MHAQKETRSKTNCGHCEGNKRAVATSLGKVEGVSPSLCHFGKVLNADLRQGWVDHVWPSTGT